MCVEDISGTIGLKSIRRLYKMAALNKKSVDDINVKGKRVLCRCDFNVPLKDGKITDENRLVAALPTIKKLIADGGKVILCSHLGKVKNGPNEGESLAPVAKRLSELLGQEVKFAADPEVVGPNAKAAVEAMKDGEVVKVEGNTCPKGEAYGKKEVTNPTRIVTSTVRVSGGLMPVVSVKTASDIPKEKIMDCARVLKDVKVQAPVAIGDVVLENICGTGVSIIATKNVSAA